MDVLNKYSGEKIGQIEILTREQIDQKITDASVFFKENKCSDITDRKIWISAIINVLTDNRNYLTNLISEEAGKPLFYAKAELDRCIRTAQLGLEYFDLIKPHQISVDLKNTSFESSFTQRFPIGVIFGISPFNFPLNLALHKIIPAIATGNSIIIKPSPLTPLSLNFLIEKVNSSLPSGLLAIVNCSDADAEYVVKHPLIKMVTFTGSDKVGWHIKSLIPKKKVTLELGGNAAVYIDRSSHLKGLPLTIAKAATLYAGQICISTQRIFVHEEIYNQFKSELIDAFNSISSGDPKENATNGPLIDYAHLKRLTDWISDAQESGAKILCGGNKISEFPPLLSPTLIEGGSASMKLFTEEAFGPVAVIQSVTNFQEATEMINNSKYGLQAGIFTNDLQVQNYMFENLEVGGVIFNGVPGFRKDEMPYGGVKDSGFGREGIFYAMEEMTEIKLGIR